ncbi:ABC transporter substrate-binding protein [Natrarchaeobius sp. A-rgal3]|uniref:ABC transporter substrate-binding protein n=1 Tax=Natrarchaeobius versutus TaxID=1679078 RepID=UPI0035105332
MTSNTLSRRGFALAAGTGAATALAGCTAFGDGSDERIVRVASRLTPSSIDPIVDGTILRRIGVIESLLRIDFDAELAPSLANSWHVEDDDLTWVFELRDDVQFHDGEPLDAAAAATALERTFDDPTMAEVPIDSIRADGEDAVEVRTERPFAPLPAHVARHEAAIVGPESFDDEGDIETLVATGPFAFDSWESGERVTVTANEEYHGTVPSIDGAVYEGVPDNQTRTLQVENGDVEMGQVLPVSAVDRFESADDVDVEIYEIPRMRCVQFNNRFEPFDDQRVRLAASYAIDREAIADDLLEGYVEPAIGPYPPTIEWANDDLDPHRYQPDRARELLEEAGWTGEEGSVRQKDGDDLAITIITYPNRPALPDIGEVLQDQLGNVGFDVDVEVLEVSAIHDRAESDADAIIWSANVYGWPADPDRLAYMYHSEEGGLHHGYENSTVDELLEEGRAAVGDRERRTEIYDEVQAITMAEAPISFLTYYEMVVATRSELSGYDHHPTEYSFHLERVELQ